MGGDEMCSDAFNPRPVLDEEGEEVEGLFRISSTKVAADGGQIDIGCGNEFGGEGGDEADNSGIETVNNVVDGTVGFGLTCVPMGKKDLKEYLGGFCKSVRQALKDDDKVAGPQVEAFTQSAPKFCKYLLSQYKELEFYVSVSIDPHASMAFAIYGESENPDFIYIKGGLLEEKC